MAVASDEQVVSARRRDGTQQAKGRRSHVLGFIHDHGGVAGAVGRRWFDGQQRGGVAVGVVNLLQAAFGKLRPVFLEDGPNQRPFGAVQPGAAAGAGNGQISLPVRHRVGLNHLLPLVFVECVRQVQFGRVHV